MHSIHYVSKLVLHTQHMIIHFILTIIFEIGNIIHYNSYMRKLRYKEIKLIVHDKADGLKPRQFISSSAVSQ